MLDRVRSRDKEKVQFVLEREMIRDIRKAAADAYQTQSKFIADLVTIALPMEDSEFPKQITVGGKVFEWTGGGYA